MKEERLILFCYKASSGKLSKYQTNDARRFVKLKKFLFFFFFNAECKENDMSADI